MVHGKLCKGDENSCQYSVVSSHCRHLRQTLGRSERASSYRYPNDNRVLSTRYWILLRVLVAQAGLPVGQRDFTSLNKHVLDVGLDVERIAIGDHHVRCLAHVQGAKAVANTPDLCRIQGDCFQSFVMRQSESDGEAGLIGKISHLMRVIRGERDLHATFV